MFEDEIFAAIADGSLLDFSSSLYRVAIPSSIAARNADGDNYLEAALKVNAQRQYNNGDAEDVWPWSPLYEVSQKILNYLLKNHPALINQQNATGMTPLMRSSAGNLADLVGQIVWLRRYSHEDIANKQIAALRYCYREIANLLLQQETINANLQDNQGRTALHHAVKNGETGIGIRLLNAGANVMLADKTGRLPLHDYVFAHSSINLTPISMFRGLCGPSFSALMCKDNGGKTALHLAFDQLTPQSSQAIRGNFLALCQLYCLQGHANMVMSLAQQSNGDLFVYLFDYRFSNTTAVSTSLETRQDSTSEAYPPSYLEDILQALARFDSDKLSSLLSNQTDEYGRKLIHRISQKDVMSLLYQYGSKLLDLNTTDKNGNTPLHALLNRRIEDIKSSVTHEHFTHLCELGANINLQNQTGATPLHLTASYGIVPYTKTLLDGNADLNIQDQEGCTPIHMDIHARKRSDVKPVSQRPLGYLALLLQYASDNAICLRDKNGRTVLHEAIMAIDVGAVICLLIRCPQLLDIKDSEGLAPLALAERQRNELLSRNDNTSAHKPGGLMDKLMSDSKTIVDHLVAMTNANVTATSPQSVNAVNARINAYAHDVMVLKVLSEERSRLKCELGTPYQPGHYDDNMHFRLLKIYARSYNRSLLPDARYNEYFSLLDQYKADRAASKQTQGMFFATLGELARMDTGGIQASSRVVVEAMSSVVPESSSSTSSNSLSSVVSQDGMKDSLSVTFMPPPPSPSSSTSLSSLSSSQPSCSYDITQRP